MTIASWELQGGDGCAAVPPRFCTPRPHGLREAFDHLLGFGFLPLVGQSNGHRAAGSATHQPLSFLREETREDHIFRLTKVLLSSVVTFVRTGYPSA